MMIDKRALRHVTERTKGHRYIVAERTIFRLSRNQDGCPGVGKKWEERMESEIRMTWAELSTEFLRHQRVNPPLDKPEHSGPDSEKTGVD